MTLYVSTIKASIYNNSVLKVACTSGPIFEKKRIQKMYEALLHIFFTNN